MTRRTALLAAAEQPETGHRLSRVPDTMTAVPAVLLAGALAVGVAPGFAEVVAHAVNEAGSGGLSTSVHWTLAGALLAAPDWALPLRRLQSGHVGDYVAWVLAGAALLGALALPGVLGA